VKNLVTGSLTLVSTSSDGIKGNGGSSFPRFAADGTLVVFMSFASNLDPGDPDHLGDVFVKELAPAPVVQAAGHAHTDYSGDGMAGRGDTHILPNVSTSMGPAMGTGTVGYDDLRQDPPGGPGRPFSCSGRPSSLRLDADNELVIGGAIRCKNLAAAVTFSLTVTDLGPNPPGQDSYHMVLFDAAGATVYDWSDPTTTDLGDLTVSTG
jgi:hypothetical protein